MLVLLAALLSAPPPGHDTNPLYREFLSAGLAVGPDARVKLPVPLLADGLSAAEQKATILTFIGGDSTWDEFSRNSAVAPQVIRLRDAGSAGPQTPVRGLDVGFIAFGDLAATDDPKFLDRILNVGRDKGNGKTITEADLTKRKIAVPDPKRESVGHVSFDLLDRVRLSVTGRAVWSRSADSLVAAAEVDPRFRGDADFPNEWRPLSKADGSLKAGEPQPYGGAGFYLKVTKLADPPGALFVEQHVVFVEPTGWFDGANLLRSKLPPVVQNNVRTMRREWAKAK